MRRALTLAQLAFSGVPLFWWFQRETKTKTAILGVPREKDRPIFPRYDWQRLKSSAGFWAREPTALPASRAAVRGGRAAKGGGEAAALSRGSQLMGEDWNLESTSTSAS